ncbi:MAG: hypothetical protein RIR52_1525 [Acidobacteriota bacterium]
MSNQSLCGVPSERKNGGPRLPRVAPWAGMRRPVGALVEVPPFWDEMSTLQAGVKPREVHTQKSGVLRERRICANYERRA